MFVPGPGWVARPRQGPRTQSQGRPKTKDGPRTKAEGPRTCCYTEVKTAFNPAYRPSRSRSRAIESIAVPSSGSQRLTVAIAQGSTTLSNYYFAGATTSALNFGTDNLAIGSYAMANATNTGFIDNIAIGYQALMGSPQLQNTGYFNTAIGYQTLMNSTAGVSNNAFGRNALTGPSIVSGAISAFANNGNGDTTVTITTGGDPAVGDQVLISGTTNYNGSYSVVSVNSGVSFDIRTPFSFWIFNIIYHFKKSFI